MTKGIFTMTQREADRLGVVQALDGRTLRQTEAATRLGLSVRQVKRLLRRYRERGAQGLVSGHRGKRAGNAFSDALREEAMALVQGHYADFGPTLASEKLLERHGIGVSRETLRQWMIADGLRGAKARKAARVHQRRPRRDCLGDLVQVDGSHHAWFEDRGERCCLLVFIDDATSRLMALRFAAAETTEGYMRTLADHLDRHGRPVAVYSDRHSIFRVSQADREGRLTQFSRALKTLDIEAIHAGTPQAKGRVERANRTLQDRLVKEMRLRGISDMEAANAFLPEFMADFNARFAVAPRNPADAHRPVLHDRDELGLILCRQHLRRLSKNLTCQFGNREYQVQHKSQGYAMRGARVLLCESFDGEVTLLCGNRRLRYRILAEGEAPAPLADEKTVQKAVDRAKARQTARPNWKPPVDHPWRRSHFGSAARP